MELKKIVSIHHPNGFFGDEHIHSHHEMVYCLEGNGTISIGRQKMQFSTGHYYLVKSKTPHKETDYGESRIIYFHFDAPADWIAEGAYADYSGMIASLAKRLHQESMNHLFQREAMLSALLTEILIESIRTASYTPNARRMEQVFQYIHENLEQEIDFARLADRYHYSYDRFRHIFKEIAGMSPHQYVIAQRIEKAKFLLSLNPNESMTSLAFRCGFASSSQFSNIFRSKEGFTPSQYKKELAARALRGEDAT